MSATTPEPPPIHTDTAAVWPLILEDLRNGLLVEPEHKAFGSALLDACERRHSFGVAKYGVPLQVENGGHPLRDARDEFLDGMAYTRQHFERLKAAHPYVLRGSVEHRRILMAWQLHLAACDVAVLCVRHLENET